MDASLYHGDVVTHFFDPPAVLAVDVIGFPDGDRRDCTIALSTTTDRGSPKKDGRVELLRSADARALACHLLYAAAIADKAHAECEPA
jgi:hypothetical protein